jgi:alkylation response protein AidB-like acyl-CoA dehydrogenase
MAFELTAEQQELAKVVDARLRTLDGKRTFLDGGPALQAEAWTALAELGVLGLLLPDEIGGTGGCVMDQVIVAEAIGRTNVGVPAVTSAVAAFVLGASTTSQGAELASLLGGGDRVVLAGISASRGIELGLRADVGDERAFLSGEVLDLVEGAAADTLLVRAELDSGSRAWFAMSIEDADACDQPSLDPSQRLLALRLDKVPAHELAIEEETRARRESVTHRALLLAYVLLAAQATGASDAALQLTLDYSKERQAFGHPIGFYQAIKHRLVDMLIATENARSATYNAAWALDDRREDSTVAAHMAKAVATENAVRVVHDAIQSHGGIGFTWEHDLHLHLRRAKSCAVVLGSPDDHFDAVGEALFEPLDDVSAEANIG